MPLQIKAVEVPEVGQGGGLPVGMLCFEETKLASGLYTNRDQGLYILIQEVCSQIVYNNTQFHSLTVMWIYGSLYMDCGY